MSVEATSTPRILVDGITKFYGGVPALLDVSIEIQRGSIHGLVGENGAGKSTLIKILAGAIAADGGTISLDGRKFNPTTPRAALAAGIATVYQDPQVIPSQSVAENIFLGRLPGRTGFVNQKQLLQQARDVLAELGITIDPRAIVSSLSTAERQLLQIAGGASYGAPGLLILDEPTSALTPGESAHLFELMRRMSNSGVSIVFVSHRLDEVLSICDHVSVLRDGQHIWTRLTSEISEDDLISAMIGRSLARDVQPEQSAQKMQPDDGRAAAALLAHAICGSGFYNIDLELHKGEIVGLFGLVGSGRTELLSALFGAAPLQGGTLAIAGQRVSHWSILKAVAQGITLVPEDRKRQGLVIDASVRSNLTMTVLQRFTRMGFISQKAERKCARQLVQQFGIKAASIETPARSLSGGNQQKVVLAKALAATPSILLLDEPTAGVDVGAKREIYAIIKKIAATGTAVLMVSSEIPEILELSDRVMVMQEGRCTGDLMRCDTTSEALLNLATGSARREQVAS